MLALNEIFPWIYKDITRVGSPLNMNTVENTQERRGLTVTFSLNNGQVFLGKVEVTAPSS